MTEKDFLSNSELAKLRVMLPDGQEVKLSDQTEANILEGLMAVSKELPASFDRTLAGRENIQPVSYWKDMGVRSSDGKNIDPNLKASVVIPDGGEPWLIFDNFRAPMFLLINHSIIK